MINNQPTYFEYLKNRSRVSLFYRHSWLYPKLNKFLSGKVLDIGVGIGDFLSFRPETVGVDIDPEAVAWCKHAGFDVRQMEIDVLPFENNSFNGIILDNVVEHLQDPAPLLAEVLRVLQNKGTVIIGVPGVKGYAADADHKNYYDEPALTALMKKSGFEKITAFGMPLGIPLLSKMLRQYCLYGIYRAIK